MTISREFIESIKEQATLATPVEQESGFAQLVAFIRAGVPDWDANNDALYRSLPFIVEQVILWLQLGLINARSYLGIFAQGARLDSVGISSIPPVVRNIGESDEDYFQRIVNAPRTLSAATLSYYEARAREALPAIVDTLALHALNRRDVTVWCLKEGYTPLTDEEILAVSASVNDRDIREAGMEAHFTRPTITDYTINVTIYHDPRRESEEAIKMQSMQALEAYTRQAQIIGGPIYRSAIFDAAHVADTIQVIINEPAYDLAPPRIDINGDGAGAYAELEVDESTGAISGIQLIRNGEGYTAATATITSPPPGGVQATATLSIITTGTQSGQIESITVGNAGSGYIAQPSSTHGVCYRATNIDVEVLP